MRARYRRAPSRRWLQWTSPRRAIAMIRRAIRSRRCERASAVLNGLPRLVERGGQDADFFGIEDARLGVYFKKVVHCLRQALFASAGHPISERHIGPLVCLKRYDGLRATITQCDSAGGHGYAWRSSIPRHRFAQPEIGSPMRGVGGVRCTSSASQLFTICQRIGKGAGLRLKGQSSRRQATREMRLCPSKAFCGRKVPTSQQ